MKKMITSIAISLTILVTGCAGSIDPDNSIYRPVPFRMGKMPEGGTPAFQHGWKDGCYTGLSTMVKSPYKAFYKFQQDPKMIHNGDYYRAWNDSYTYCRQYAFRFTWKNIFDSEKMLWFKSGAPPGGETINEMFYK